MLRVVVAVSLSGCSFSVDAAVDAGDGGPTADWWDDDWGFRIPLSIGAITPVFPGVQIGFPFDVDVAPCGPDRNDVRIVLGELDLPRVIDEFGAGDEWIWFQLRTPIAANATSEEYWLYCGNPAAPPAPADPQQVFTLHDDFDGALDARWVTQGAVTVAGGAVSLPPISAIHTNTAFSPNTAVDFVAKATPGAVTTPYFWAGFGAGFTFAGPWVRWFGGYSTGQIRASTNQTSPDDGPVRVLDGAPRLYGVENYDHSALFRLDNRPVDPKQFPMPIGIMMNVVVLNHTSDGPIEIDMLRVRQTVTPYPMVVVGTPEPRPR